MVPHKCYVCFGAGEMVTVVHNNPGVHSDRKGGCNKQYVNDIMGTLICQAQTRNQTGKVKKMCGVIQKLMPRLTRGKW